MSGTLRGKNIFDATTSGFVLDTVAASKTIDLKTNGVSRLTISDTGVALSGNGSVNRLVEGYLLINTSGGIYNPSSTAPKHLRFWGTTAGSGVNLPNATTTPVGTSWTIYNTSTVPITIYTFVLATTIVSIETNYSATFVLIDTSTDAVASWSITSMGVPTNISTNLALTSNGVGYLPTYRPIYPVSSTGTWTPALRYGSLASSGFPVDSNTFDGQVGKYLSIQVSTTHKMNTYSFEIQIDTYSAAAGLTNAPIITGFIAPAQHAYSVMNVVSTTGVTESYNSTFPTASSSFEVELTYPSTVTNWTTIGGYLYNRGGSGFSLTSWDKYTGSVTFYSVV